LIFAGGPRVLDGELLVLDDAGRSLFNELLFGRRRPTYVAFDLLIAGGIDLRPLPLRHRKAVLARVGERAEGWIARTNRVVGEGRALYQAVVDADLEGIVASILSTPSAASRAWGVGLSHESSYIGRGFLFAVAGSYTVNPLLPLQENNQYNRELFASPAAGRFRAWKICTHQKGLCCRSRPQPSTHIRGKANSPAYFFIMASR
jgi:hypothetical protein